MFPRAPIQRRGIAVVFAGSHYGAKQQVIASEPAKRLYVPPTVDSQKLLILACSRTKRTADRPLPALERYDGPPFRVLRNFLQSRPARVPHVFILSSWRGLITVDTPLPWYDRVMDQQRAIELRATSTILIGDYFGELRTPDQTMDVMVCASKIYQLALPSFELWRGCISNVEFVAGKPGDAAARLFAWLHDDNPPAPVGFTVRQCGAPCERDQDLLISALHADPAAAAQHVSWYLELDGRIVSAKWAAGVLTGKAHSEFSTHTALRLLQRRGFLPKRT